MKIAIQGHPTRGKEIIQILKSLGATSYGTYDTCSHPEWYWYINKNKEITCDHKKSICGYKLYTLEEFEKEFPFKVGDNVQIEINNIIYLATITDIVDIDKYKVKYLSGNIGFIDKKYINITLTLDKAKEWYKKGGELREIALQAFTEKELTLLPRSWEEFCEKYPTKNGECWIGSQDIIYCAIVTQDRNCKNWIPSRRSAKAHLAMIQLEQLRDCWRQGWIPSKGDDGFGIRFDFYEGFRIVKLYSFSAFLSFPTEEMAKEFLKCFRDLIEQIGDLI